MVVVVAGVKSWGDTLRDGRNSKGSGGLISRPNWSLRLDIVMQGWAVP